MKDHSLLLKIKQKLENNSLHTIKSITTMDIKYVFITSISINAELISKNSKNWENHCQMRVFTNVNFNLQELGLKYISP